MASRPFAQGGPGYVAKTYAQQCSRCQGLMVETWLGGMAGTGDPSGLWAWRCVNCGNVYNTGFASNRLKTDFPNQRGGARRRFRSVPQSLS